MIDGKKTHAMSWVILTLAVVAGGIDAFLRSCGDAGIAIPAGWLAALGAVLAAAQAGLRNLTTGPAASPRAWGAPSWLGLAVALILAALAARGPNAPVEPAAPATPATLDAEMPPGAPELPQEGQEAPTSDIGAPEAPEGVPGAILGVLGGALNLGCSAAQVRAWEDGATRAATCLAGCGASALSYRIVPGAREVRLEGLPEDLLRCALPCLLRVGVATVEAVATPPARWGGSAGEAQVYQPDTYTVTIRQ